MDCETLLRYLSDYIDGELDEALAEAAREHLATCHNCSVMLDTTQRTIRLYRDEARARIIPASRHQRLFNELSELLRRPSDEPSEPKDNP